MNSVWILNRLCLDSGWVLVQLDLEMLCGFWANSGANSGSNSERLLCGRKEVNCCYLEKFIEKKL